MSITSVCAYHPQYFGVELVISKGTVEVDDEGNIHEPMISHGCCPTCLEIELAIIQKNSLTLVQH